MTDINFFDFKIGLMVEASKIVVDTLVWQNGLTLSRRYASTTILHNNVVSMMKNALRIASTIKLYSASCKRTC